jgi:hypothetical protein
MTKDIDLTISTINYNVTDKLKRCIKSFLETYSDEEFNYEWFIIDNNSVEEERVKFNEVKKQYSDNKKIRFIQHDDNLGLAVLNTILDEVRGRYWLFLDPDTWQINKAISKLIKYMDFHPNVGIMSAMQYKPNGKPLLYYAAHFNVSKVFFIGTILGEAIDRFLLASKMRKMHYPWEYDNITFKDLTEIDQVPFACTMERMELLKEDGYVIDPDFTFMFNDVDLCKRAKDKGYKVMLMPSAKIIHDMGSAYKKRKNIWKRIITIKAQIKYFHKYHPYKIWFLKIFFFLDVAILRFLKKFYISMKNDENMWKQLFYFQLYQLLN